VRITGRHVGLALVAVVACISCRAPETRLGDLQEIQAAGRIRIVVRPGFFASPLRGIEHNDQEILIRQLAARLELDVEWLEARRADEVLPSLVNGLADVAIARFSPAELPTEEIAATEAVGWVEDLVVASRRLNIAGIDSLAGRSLHVHASAANALLSSDLGRLEPPVKLVPVPEETPLEGILERTKGGRYDVCIADSDMVEVMRGAGRIRILGPVTGQRPLVWAVRRSNSHLRAAINDFVFAEQVLGRGNRTPECRDLAQIRQAGVLRLVTRNSPTTCTIDRGGLEGFEYDLARTFARRLGVRLELSMAPPGRDPLDWLAAGYGDLAALHEPMDPDRAGAFLPTEPYRAVDMVAVVPSNQDRPAAVEDMAGRPVAASRPVQALWRLMPLEPARDPFDLPVGGDALSALSEVSRGQVNAAIVDRDTARLELETRPDLQLGPVVMRQIPLVWVVSPGATRLQATASGYLRSVRRSGLVRQLALSELGRWRRFVPAHIPPVPDGALTPYDELLKGVARRESLDWRLMASLMYEESRFDPTAVGPGGSAGLFQFMPFTWRELGVQDPHDPIQAAPAAGLYLRRLMDQFVEAPFGDRVAMAIASYNVGPRHVADARSMAREMGFDPNRWADSVETALLLLNDPEVARRFPAGVCRCRRAVGYTRRILRRYAAYAEQFPPM